MRNENIKDSFPRMSAPPGLEVPPEFFENFELDFGGEYITGIRVAKDLSQPSNFAFIHGARGGNWSRVMSFAKPVVEQGSSIVSFDHSGHGGSSGKEKESSLEKRVLEARAVIDRFADGKPRTISGSSMGGYTAVKLLENYDAQNLILYCPALYDKDAYSVPFDSGFTEIIRRQNSWENTDAREILNKFEGNLLVIIGSEDKTIPRGVIALIESESKKANRKEILTLPGVPHAIHDWLVAHPEEAKRVAEKVADFSR